ncbi:MAG: tRNA lysidine(34) synthetase TilS [Eggerthellaceae bacterium]|nr:tRNA lysidine(34) synthetase TilS [Eggerthellaceae bacterium]
MAESLNAPLLSRVAATLADRDLVGPEAAALLMVSGGSDSAALAYIAAELQGAGQLGPVAMLHVHHHMRGADADADAEFAAALAELLGFPFFRVDVNVNQLADEAGENREAVARRERYAAAHEALASMCLHEARPLAEGRILTAHSADDRIENFYMRSIVGTGPGGFRSMLYRNGPVVRPLLDVSRQQLRDYLEARAREGRSVVRDASGALWREDATNAHTDRFRAYVRHNLVPVAREWNPQLTDVLVRTMNQIADEDDMLDEMTTTLIARCVTIPTSSRPEPEGRSGEIPCAPKAEGGTDPHRHPERSEGSFGSEQSFLIKPAFATEPRPLQKRAIYQLLLQLLPPESRLQSASIGAVLAAINEDGSLKSGYVANIQGNLAVSANKHGILIEPMAAFRTRRKK